MCICSIYKHDGKKYTFTCLRCATPLIWDGIEVYNKFRKSDENLPEWESLDPCEKQKWIDLVNQLSEPCISDSDSNTDDLLLTT